LALDSLTNTTGFIRIECPMNFIGLLAIPSNWWQFGGALTSHTQSFTTDYYFVIVVVVVVFIIYFSPESSTNLRKYFIILSYPLTVREEQISGCWKEIFGSGIVT
jgi:hypothetical protein